MKTRCGVERSSLRSLCTFAGNNDGTSAIEYALIAGGIALAIIVSVPAIGVTLADWFTTFAGLF